ncbi:MAG: PAS domain-containing protein [Pseudomonadota bacterium]
MDKPEHKAHSVIAMSEYRPETGYAAIAQVEAYWEAVRGARLLPKRSDIDPRGIEQCLEHAFILERVAAGIARLRIAGTHLNDLIGMEVRGMPLTTFFTPAARAVVSEQLEVVFQTPAICTLDLSSAASIGRPSLQARLILLPLKSDLGDVSRVLGCLVAKGDIGSAPRRFDIAGRKVLHIAPGAVPQSKPPHPPKTPATTPLPIAQEPRKAHPPGLAEEQATFSKPSSDKRRPPYLRLIKTDDP